MMFRARRGWRAESARRVMGWGPLVAVTLVGLFLLASREPSELLAWQASLQAHSTHFLIWRLCLYTATLSVWVRMRRRLNLAAAHRHRLLRAEIGALVALMLLEARVLLA